MKVSLKKAFSILDGRLSTNMSDVYEMLNYIVSDNLQTIQLPFVIEKIKKINPAWFKNGIKIIELIKRRNKTDDFKILMEIIDKDYSDCEVEICEIINFYSID